MSFIRRYSLHIAWLISIIATLTSLIFSNILGLIPCDLCWYQRIAMYPLVLILGIGILKNEQNVILFALPFTLIGMLISLYQIFLQKFPFINNILPCNANISCAEDQLNLFHLITIPMLSFVGFITIFSLFIVNQNYKNKFKNENFI